MDFTFSDSHILGFAIRAIFDIAIPFIMIFIAYKKFDGRLYPFLIGIVSMNLLVLPRIFLRNIFAPDPDNKVIDFLIFIFIGAACEEISRFLMMKYMMKNHDTIMDAVCYGIGHWGMELIPQSYYSIDAINTCNEINRTGYEGMISGLSVEETAVFAEKLEMYMSLTLPDNLIIMIICIFSMAMQISWSVLAFIAIYRPDRRIYLLGALITHILMNIYVSGFVFELTAAAAICFFTYLAAKESDLPVKQNYYI
ncbi:MAG: YhfC family intramembrane metalloprotease [Oscillospiraceae bacterium]|nr:YhfC family intramembrane metalloprotease [Oscillospiraceae bacterium]